MEPAAVKSRGVGDLISGLPDDLLHIILVDLQSIAAAARTSVLSRRWRRVWTYLPELDLGGSTDPKTASSAAILHSIDAVIESYSAPALHRLEIVASDETDDLCDAPAHRVAAWLRFASQRLTGRLRIHLPYFDGDWPAGREELPLPVCERSTEIVINTGLNFVLRPPPIGSFTALTVLAIVSTEVDSGELGRVVSMQCPRLQKLHLVDIRFVATYDGDASILPFVGRNASRLSIRSESLECLEYYSGGIVDRGELEVTAPMLLEISVGQAAKAYIVAPTLEKVEWKSSYNPDHHQFAVAPRHLRSLFIKYSTWLHFLSSTWLIQRFDTAMELTVFLAIHEGIIGYTSFLMDLDKLPVCETLIIHLFKNRHALAPMMLPLLRRCSCIRKLELFFDWRIPSEMESCITSNCPCILPGSCQLDDTTFKSLEEIGIKFFTGSTEEEIFLKLLLSRSNMVTLKRVNLLVPSVPVSSKIMEVVERIHSMCYPKTNVHFNVSSMEAPLGL